MASRIWIDVEDIFAFALSGSRRPTGIQRLAYELCKAMLARDPERVRFVRHDRLRDSFAIIPWSDLDTLFTGLTEPAAAARKPAGPVRLHGRSNGTQQHKTSETGKSVHGGAF